jgi:hypothetical protein
MRVILQREHYPFRVNCLKPVPARLCVYLPPRLALNKAIPTPTMTATAPAAAQDGDPPTIGSQFATQSIGRIWIIAMPWRNQSRPRAAMKAPASTPAIRMNLILSPATGACFYMNITSIVKEQWGGIGDT